MKIRGRSVEMFRCHIDPMIGPKPRNAFVPSDLNMKAEVAEDADAIIVTLANGQTNVVWGTNVQSFRLSPVAEVTEIKRAPGRPKSEAV